MTILTRSSDSLGIVSSALCLVHCLATPFIFVAQASSCCEATPGWWQWVDYGFLIISFMAIYRSIQTTRSNWIKWAFSIAWVLLLTIILNEKFEWVHLPHEIIYIPALVLIVLHLYNKRYCQCKKDTCCTINNTNL